MNETKPERKQHTFSDSEVPVEEGNAQGPTLMLVSALGDRMQDQPGSYGHVCPKCGRIHSHHTKFLELCHC